jgi:hypothetical protein
MIWTKDKILAELRRLSRTGARLSYVAMTQSHQSLVSAAAYHFGSYRQAVEAAGLDYAALRARPRWNKQNVIALLKQARRGGEDLHWSAVSKRRDALGRAAFAAVQPRLFGSWVRALSAAGIDVDDVSPYRKWDKNSIAFELKSRAADGNGCSSGAVQVEDPGLHAAALRYFGTYDAALRAARIDPDKVRLRRRWTKVDVVKSIKQRKSRKLPLSDTVVRKDAPGLYGAAVRLFGTYTAARHAAGGPPSRKSANGKLRK